DIFDVVGRDADAGELLDELLRLRPGDRAGLGGRARLQTVGDAGVPQQIIAAVANEVAIVRDVPRLADLDAGRPARLVRRMALAAIHDIEAVAALRLLLRRGADGEQCRG